MNVGDITSSAGPSLGKPAIVLVSGGLDSATVLAIARAQGYRCHALSFDYGQRHRAELDAATAVARVLGAAEHRIMKIDFAGIGGSALTDLSIAVPQTPQSGIPITYVPARNTVFLAMALGWAEVLCAADLFIGVNAIDYSGYPDCRPAFIEAFQTLAGLATKAGVEGSAEFKIHTPLIELSKAQIIQKGIELGVDFRATVSCYQSTATGEGCGVCDSCRLRRDGFKVAGVPDPTRYVMGFHASGA
jgi:7-cyano-7-deazaguanine synthase